MAAMGAPAGQPENGGPGCLPQQDGRIAIPEPLRMYMGGKAYIG